MEALFAEITLPPKSGALVLHDIYKPQKEKRELYIVKDYGKHDSHVTEIVSPHMMVKTCMS